MSKEKTIREKKQEPSSKKHYHKKGKGRKGTSPKANKRLPSKLYVAKCCNAPATKEPCGIPAATKEDPNAKTGLGTWHCTVCKKKAKVSVTRVAVEARDAVIAAVKGVVA